VPEGVCRGGLCAPARCGDGLIDPGEECDDGNTDNDDACLADCRDAFCGDRFVRTGVEACDGDPPRTCDTTCGTTGDQSCTEECSWTACDPPGEVCNAVDDDCDRSTDEEFDCIRGLEVPCETTCGSGGSGACNAECEAPSGAACEPPPETCNGEDDDCDTVRDDGYPCYRGQTEACSGSGGCTGTRTCTNSCAWGACILAAEACDGTDNDCDGWTDEGYSCVLGSTERCDPGGSCPGRRTCLSGCVWGPCVGAAPANDVCTTSAEFVIPAEPGGYFFSGDTCAAANDYSLVCGSTAGAGRDVVYRLDLASSRVVTIDTYGSLFDTVLFLRRDDGSCPGDAVGCSDDDPLVGGTRASRYRATLAAGGYWIVVDGKTAADYGPYWLNVTIGSSAPANDTCPGAATISPDTTLRSTSGTTAGADSENQACNLGGPAPDVWYRFTLAASTAVFLSTQDGRGWDSTLVLYPSPDASCPAAAATASCADDSCGNRRSLLAGILAAGTYYVLVDGFAPSAAGEFTLYYQASTCVAAVDAVPLTPEVDPLDAVGSSRYLGSTTGQGDDAHGSCAGPTGSAPDVYYFAGLCPDTAPRFSTCDSATNFVTSIYARYGSCSGTQVACDRSATCPAVAVGPRGAIEVATGPGGQGLYYVWIDGYLGSNGDYALLVNP
jgi:hypothetical protein